MNHKNARATTAISGISSCAGRTGLCEFRPDFWPLIYPLGPRLVKNSSRENGLDVVGDSPIGFSRPGGDRLPLAGTPRPPGAPPRARLGSPPGCRVPGGPPGGGPGQGVGETCGEGWEGNIDWNVPYYRVSSGLAPKFLDRWNVRSNSRPGWLSASAVRTCTSIAHCFMSKGVFRDSLPVPG